MRSIWIAFALFGWAIRPALFRWLRNLLPRRNNKVLRLARELRDAQNGLGNRHELQLLRRRAAAPVSDAQQRKKLIALSLDFGEIRRVGQHEVGDAEILIFA